MKKLTPKDKAVHDQFCVYGKNAKEWMNKCVLLLPKIERSRIWEKKGFSSIYEYAAKIAGMSRNKVDDSLRIIRKITDKPELMKIAKKKGLNSVRPVATIATKEDEDFWAKKASEMSKNTLAVYVRDYKIEKQNIGTSRPGTRSPIDNSLNKLNLSQENLAGNTNSEKIQISMKLDPEVTAELKMIKGNEDWNEVMRKLLKFSRQQLEAEKRRRDIEENRLQKELKAKKPEIVTTNNHRVTTAIKKHIIKRSKGICEHPNCNKSGKHFHHIEPFALKKEHNPDKLLFLCEEHHQIIHLGYIDDSALLTKSRPDSWKQISKLPYYDIKNMINKRIAEFKQ